MEALGGRREFLRRALATAGSAILPPLAAFTPARAASTLEAHELRPGLTRIAGAGGNVLLYRSAGGIALVDSGDAAASEALAALVAERTGGAPVDLLLNTHWHLEHTGGNERFGAAGATIAAHENTRLWMSTEFYVDWQDRTYPARPAAARPTKTFYSSDAQPITVTLGNEQIEYGHLREAHTDGDVYVRFVERNVIAAGGAVSVRRYPVPDYVTGGWIGGLANATRKLLELADRDTLIVPDEGPPQTRADLEAQLEMLTTVRGRMEEQMRIGRSAADMLADGITAEFDERWGNDPELFIVNCYEGLWWGGRLSGAI